MDLRLHLRAPPAEHASAVVDLGRDLSREHAFRALAQLPAPSEWFRVSGSSLIVGGRQIQGVSAFASGVEPVWEDPAHSTGCTVKACGTGSVDTYWKAFLGVAHLIGQDGTPLEKATGVKLVDKSNKNRTEHRLEIWFAERPSVSVNKTVSSYLGCRVSVANHEK